MVFFTDRLALDTPRRTADGYMVVRARAARTGVYDYAGYEVDPDNTHGLRDKAVVKVLRDDATVFDEASARSFVGKPITDSHPNEAVTADNWRDHARGVVMGAMRDGDYLAFDLLLTDAEAIGKIGANGGSELSNGYSSKLEFGDFTAADGTKCQARQTSIMGNHVALVDQGRAGPECAIKSGFATCDALPPAILDGLKHQEKYVPKITLDGLVVDLSDAAAVEAAIKKFQDAATAAQAELADAKAKISTLTGEKVALEKQVADAKSDLDPAKLDQRVADRASLVAKAKAIKSDIVTDGQTDAAIRKAIVVAKLGDAASAMDDGAISGAFAVIAKDIETKDAKAAALGAPVTVKDARTVTSSLRADWLAAKENAHRPAMTA
ncbi:MAG: DUF2213 domain-containing protein [Sphingomonadales bacterium]|nr:MAG: DUF2213 domain-containing protein [Sphingomonadales bacterium]